MEAPAKEKVLRIVLVRHGETEWNKIGKFQGQSDAGGLNERGRAQVDALALALREEPLKAIYSSPIARAVQTAEAINRYHQVSLERRDGLMEMNVGSFEGLQPKDRVNEHPEFLRKWFEDPASVRMPKGETLSEVQERAWAVMEEIATAQHEGSVLLCGHNFVNLMILCKTLGLEVTHFRRLRQGPSAMNIIERRRGLYFTICINDTCHLKEIDAPS